MRKRLQLISTDFDGTLIESSEGDGPPSEFFHRLKRARQHGEVTWVINTGRDWPSLREQIELRKFPIWPDWVVLVERHIYKVSGRDLISFHDWNEACAAAHKDLFEKSKPFFDEIRAHAACHTNASVIVDVGSPVGLIAETEEEADQLHAWIDRRLQDYPDLTVVRNSVYFRFAHADYHKGSCLRALAGHLKVPTEAILAAGDHCNDLMMLDSSAAGGIVCPINAVDVVKAKVRSHGGHVASDVHGHGVVEGWNVLFPMDGDLKKSERA